MLELRARSTTIRSTICIETLLTDIFEQQKKFVPLCLWFLFHSILSIRYVHKSDKTFYFERSRPNNFSFPMISP